MQQNKENGGKCTAPIFVGYRSDTVQTPSFDFLNFFNYLFFLNFRCHPYTHRDFYINSSPLFNSDKIHTPQPFVHGDDEHNMHVGESIQKYAALKLPGCPTSMVLVTDLNYHITE